MVMKSYHKLIIHAYSTQNRHFFDDIYLSIKGDCKNVTPLAWRSYVLGVILELQVDLLNQMELEMIRAWGFPG